MSVVEMRTSIEPSLQTQIAQVGAIAMKPQSSKTIYFIGGAGLRSVCANHDCHIRNQDNRSGFVRLVVRRAAMNVDYRGSRRGWSSLEPYDLVDLLRRTYPHCVCDRGSDTQSTAQPTGNTS